MKTILFIISLAIVPFVIGNGLVKAFLFIKGKIHKADTAERSSAICRFAVNFSTGAVALLAISGAVNAVAVITHLSIGTAGKLFLAVVACVFMLALIISIVALIKRTQKKNSAKPNDNKTNSLTLILFIASGLIAIAQIMIIARADGITYLGDQTLETVNSFLITDQLYSVDPLTGNPYINGYPFRLSLQCLPFLYTILAKYTGITASVIVWQIMPAFWLVCGYCTFMSIGDSLLRTTIQKQVFLLICQFLLWCTNSGAGATGFNIFHSGFSASTVLELLIIGWTLSVLLSGNTLAALLTIAVEPFVASTKFGIGVCFVLMVAFIVIPRLPFVKKMIADIQKEASATTSNTKKGGADEKL